MTSEIVAVLDARVPTLFVPVALTDEPFAGSTVTVTGVFSGRFWQLTTTGIGFVSEPGMSVSGVMNCPVDLRTQPRRQRWQWPVEFL